MNNGILARGYSPPQMPRPLLGRPTPVSVPYATTEGGGIPTGLSLWLDAADDATLFSDVQGTIVALPGDSIASWRDKGPSSYLFTQGTANNRPTKVAASMNGLNGIRFDGSNDCLYALSKLYGTEITVLTVLRLNNLTAQQYAYDMANISSTVSFSFSPNTYNSTGRKFGFYGPNVSYDSDAATTTQGIVSLLAAPLASNKPILNTLTYRINGTQRKLTRIAGSQTTWNLYGSSIGTMIGSMNNSGSGANGYLNGIFYEIMVWKRLLSQKEYENMELYAYNKWGIPS